MHHTQKTFIYISIAFILIGIAALLFLTLKKPSAPVTSTTQDSTSTSSASTEASLGGQMYAESQNPIGDKVPGISPAANPIENAYTNPFE